MPRVTDLHRRATAAFASRLQDVGPDQWSLPTPCSEWDVRALVAHNVEEQRWVPPIVEGRHIEEVTDVDADLGDDPWTAWETATAAALAAVEAPGALEREVHLSFGTVPAELYVQQRTTDLLVHAWDLARAVGSSEDFDEELAGHVLGWTAPWGDQLVATGLFAPAVPVPADAPPMARLLGMLGRRP